MDTFSLRNVQYENRSLDTMRFSGGSQTAAVSPSLRERDRESKSVCVFLRSFATARPCLSLFVLQQSPGENYFFATTDSVDVHEEHRFSLRNCDFDKFFWFLISFSWVYVSSGCEEVDCWGRERILCLVVWAFELRKCFFSFFHDSCVWTFSFVLWFWMRWFQNFFVSCRLKAAAWVGDGYSSSWSFRHRFVKMLTCLLACFSSFSISLAFVHLLRSLLERAREDFVLCGTRELRQEYYCTLSPVTSRRKVWSYSRTCRNQDKFCKISFGMHVDLGLRCFVFESVLDTQSIVLPSQETKT